MLLKLNRAQARACSQRIRGINPDSLAARPGALVSGLVCGGGDLFSRWNYANPRSALQVGYKIKKARDRSRRCAGCLAGWCSDTGLGRFRSLTM